MLNSGICDTPARTTFYDRERLAVRSYSADHIQLGRQELAALDTLGLLRPWPTNLGGYVSAVRTWQQFLIDSIESPILTSGLPDKGVILLAAFGIGEPGARDRAAFTLMTGACHILSEEYQQAWDILSVSALDHPDIYHFGDLPQSILIMLKSLACLLRDADGFVRASRGLGIDQPAWAEETLASAITSTRRHDPDFADALEAAQRTIPTESDGQRLLRLGLSETNTTDTLIGLWDTQPEMIDLQGPLPPCVINTVVVCTSPIRSDHVLHAAMRGGGTLTCRIDPAVATAAAPALISGNLFDVTVLIAADLSDAAGLAMTAMITRIEPYGGEVGLVSFSGRIEVSDFELSVSGRLELTDFDSDNAGFKLQLDDSDPDGETVDLAERIATAIESSYDTPATAFPPYSDPYIQARSWGQVDASALLAAHDALTRQHPYTARRWRPAGSVVKSRGWHYLRLSAFSGTLPPTAPHNSGWRGPAETIWGGRNHLDFDQAAILPGRVLRHLSNTTNIKPFLTAPQDTLDEYCHLVEYPNLDVDRHGRWDAIGCPPVLRRPHAPSGTLRVPGGRHGRPRRRIGVPASRHRPKRGRNHIPHLPAGGVLQIRMDASVTMEPRGKARRPEARALVLPR